MANKKVSDFSIRLKDLMEEKRITQAELARQTGITPSSISDWLNCKYDPKQDKIDVIAEALNVSPSYLMGYDVPRDRIDLTKIPGVIPIRKIKKIPILGQIICGEPLTNYENFDGYVSIDPSIFTADFCLKAEGDSMIEANIHEGDYIFIKQTPQVENGAISAVLIDDKTTLKKFYKTESEIILQACNTNYPPIVIRGEEQQEVSILGEMTGVYSKRNK